VKLEGKNLRVVLPGNRRFEIVWSVDTACVVGTVVNRKDSIGIVVKRDVVVDVGRGEGRREKHTQEQQAGPLYVSSDISHVLLSIIQACDNVPSC
jgi:hypothetical protein